MKKFLGLVFSVLLVALIIVGFAVWKGNQPLLTYYENGQIKTLTQRHFFKANGEYNKYNEDGTLSQQYTLLNGRKIGTAHIYGNQVVFDVSYLNGKPFGLVKISPNNPDPDLEDLKINIGENMNFNVSDSTDESWQVDGIIKCADEEFFASIQAVTKQQNAETVKSVLRCLSWNKFFVNESDFKCSYEGDYQYPTFMADSHFSCKGFNDLLALKDSYADMVSGSSDKPAGNEKKYLNVNADYSVENKALNISVVNNDSSYKQVQTYKGFENIADALLSFGLSQQESKDWVNLAVSLVKNLTIGESSSMVNGKKIADTQGEFNLMTGFTNPWTASFYDTDETVSTQLKISDKGIMLNTRYPISKSPMLALSMQISDKVKAKYQNLLNTVIAEFENKEMNEAIQSVVGIWPQYAMDFTDVLQSVNVILFNKQGEKVIAGVASMKKGVNLASLMMTPEVAVDLKIITYKDNQVNKVITGNLADGFMVDGKNITVDELLNYLDKEALEQVMKDIDAEFYEVYKNSEQKEKDGQLIQDPFMSGFYSGYVKAMLKYKTNKTIDQTSMIIAGTRILFTSQENYAKLDNDLAKRYKIIPEEMISEAEGKAVNAFGGAVNVYASDKEKTDDNLAFVIEMHGLPDEVCRDVAMEDWRGVNGFIAMSVNEPVDDKYVGNCKPQENVVCAGDEMMNPFVAYQNCQNENNNTIYWKYF